MLEPPSTPSAHEATIGVYPWSVSIGMPCAEIKLIEKPHVKNEPASCQNASVLSASLAVTRSILGAATPGSGGAPSAVRPTDSGESRITHRQSGSETRRISPAMTT